MNPQYQEILDTLSSTKDNNSRVLLVDGLNMFIRVFSAVPSVNDNGNHVGGVSGFLKSLASEIKSFGATRCVVVFDGKGGSYRRRRLYPQYKANRKVRKSLNRFNEFKDLVDEQQSMQQQLGRLFQYLNTLPVYVVSIDNIEADDSIAYLTRTVFKQFGSQIRIVSTDRDFLQLVNEGVEVWSPVKKKLYTKDSLAQEFGIHPSNYILYRAMTGDSSDNIPGIKGLGLKSVIKYVNILDRPVTLDQLIQYCEQQSEVSKYKIYKTIAENKELLQLNYALMQLSDVDISTYAKSNIREITLKQQVKLQSRQFLTLYNEDMMHNAIKSVDRWLMEGFRTLSIYG